jgi:hypothetical protein
MISIGWKPATHWSNSTYIRLNHVNEFDANAWLETDLIIKVGAVAGYQQTGFSGCRLSVTPERQSVHQVYLEQILPG